MRFDAVIFDMDGTLLDTLDDIADAMNSVLEAHGQPTHPVDAYRYFVGDGIQALVRRSLPQHKRGDETVEELTSEIRGVYKEYWNVKTKPYDGIAEMLDGLVERGIRIAILSNKPDEFTRQCVKGFLSNWPFDVIIGHQVDVAAKPDPAGAKQIAEELGVPPERVLYVGDTNVDMRTAVAAGMYPVGALWGFRTREELEASGSEAVIEHPRELLGLLE